MVSTDNGASAVSGKGTNNQVAGAGVSPANSGSLLFGEILSSVYAPNQEASDQGASYINISSSAAGSSVGITLYYKMMGQDHTTTTLDTWLVINAPDYSATQYTGGLSLPLRNITVAGSWTQ